MLIGNLLLYFSIFIALVGIIFSFLHLKIKNNKFLRYSKLITFLLFAIISITIMYIYIMFLTSDISLDYVWRYTSTTHPIQYKFAGVLAGMAGSLLFWIWAIITPWFFEEIKTISPGIWNSLFFCQKNLLYHDGKKKFRQETGYTWFTWLNKQHVKIFGSDFFELGCINKK